MFECAVCGCKESRSEVVDEVFKIDGEYVLVERIPAEVCSRCGEQSFSLETAETVRRMVSKGVIPTRSIEMRVFQFASIEMSNQTTRPLRHANSD